jgi:hypothetical protein
MSLRPVSALRVAAATVVASLLLAGCGGGSDEDGQQAEGSPTPTESPSPTSTVAVPESATLTETGTDLEFGDSATVIFEPDQKSGTVLELTVNKATQGTLKDFSAFILDDYTKKARPYYVDVVVENVGEDRVGGAPVPLWGVDATNTLLPPASFTTKFGKCPSDKLPKKFKPGDRLKTCLVFLAPDKGDLEAVSFRPNQEFDPIQWTGTVEEPEQTKKQSKKDKKKNQG